MKAGRVWAGGSGCGDSPVTEGYFGEKESPGGKRCRWGLRLTSLRFKFCTRA